jgi:hypothetical protein
MIESIIGSRSCVEAPHESDHGWMVIPKATAPDGAVVHALSVWRSRVADEAHVLGKRNQRHIAYKRSSAVQISERHLT